MPTKSLDRKKFDKAKRTAAAKFAAAVATAELSYRDEMAEALRQYKVDRGISDDSVPPKHPS